VNLGRAVQAAYEAGVLLAGGGHAMAAGLTMRPGAIPEFRAFLNERLKGEVGEARAADALDLDILVTPAAASRDLVEAFASLAPFGPGNPEPLFAVCDVRIERAGCMRGEHVRCDLVDSSGARLRAIAWRAGQTDLGRRLLAGGSAVHVAGRLRPDDWGGRRSVQLEIEDLADPRMAGA
jgi:single-stranded-DNA-specific exonuclease